MINIISIFRKRSKLIVSSLLLMLLITVLILAGKYGYIKYLKYKVEYKERKYEARFQEALDNAAKIPSSFWDEKYKNMQVKDKYKVVIITHYGGEYVYAEYFKYAAEKIGWEVQIYYKQALGHEREILSFDPDFIIMTQLTNSDYDNKLIAHRSKKYLLNLSSLQRSRDYNGKLWSDNPYTQEVGYLDPLIAMAHGTLTFPKEVEIYSAKFKMLNKDFNGIGLLPKVPNVKDEHFEFQPKNLVWSGAGWDQFRSSDTYKKFISLLSENVPMKVYGPLSNKAFHDLAPHVYDGYIEPGIENIKAIQKNGVYLITHSNFHFFGKDPSMRVFEAVAANAIVISDRHPFVVEHFGDSFLYFDYNADAYIMYKQVKKHFDWIQKNPAEAKAMADRAHKIFLEKFTLEKDLIRIGKMHEYILQQEKEMNLSYPLAY